MQLVTCVFENDTVRRMIGHQYCTSSNGHQVVCPIVPCKIMSAMLQLQFEIELWMRNLRDQPIVL